MPRSPWHGDAHVGGGRGGPATSQKSRSLRVLPRTAFLRHSQATSLTQPVRHAPARCPGELVLPRCEVRFQFPSWSLQLPGAPAHLAHRRGAPESIWQCGSGQQHHPGNLTQSFDNKHNHKDSFCTPRMRSDVAYLPLALCTPSRGGDGPAAGAAGAARLAGWVSSPPVGRGGGRVRVRPRREKAGVNAPKALSAAPCVRPSVLASSRPLPSQPSRFPALRQRRT